MQSEHSYWIQVEEARAVQHQLAGKVISEGEIEISEVKTILGVDAAVTCDRQHIIGAAVLLCYPSLTVDYISVAQHKLDFPYIPGFLSFREIPVLLKAIAKTPKEPELVIVDGQGIAHPRLFGLASHLGVVTGLRTIGCAKNRLVGECGELGREKGEYVPCTMQGILVGYQVRTRTGVKGVWVSPGHRIGHLAAVHWILRTITRFRLPEPIRFAHNAANEYRQSIGG